MGNKKGYIGFVAFIIIITVVACLLVTNNNRYDDAQDNGTIQTSNSEKESNTSDSSVEENAEQDEQDAVNSVDESEPSEEPFDPASYPLVDFNAWNHDDVEYASKLQVTGTVIQAMKSDEGMNLRLAINDDYDQVVLITIEDSDYQDVIAEDDNVTVYGLNAGLTSYKTVMGNEQTIPAMLGTNYTVNSYGQ